MEISKRKIDGRAQRDGERINGAEVGLASDVTITTRSTGAWAYKNEVTRLTQIALAKKARDKSIPRSERAYLTPEEEDAVETEALISKCLVNVEGLTDDNVPLPFAAVCDLIRDPDFVIIKNGCRLAAAKVGIPQDLDLFEDDAPNSPRPSDGSSPTAASPNSSAQ